MSNNGCALDDFDLGKKKKTVVASGTGFNKGYVLWNDVLFSLEALSRGASASAASVRLSSGLAAPLVEQGISIQCLSHLRDAYWPKGPLVSGNVADVFATGIGGEIARYLNLPKLRGGFLRRGYARAFKKMEKKHGLPCLAIFANLDQVNIQFFNHLNDDLDIPCIVFASDVPSTSSRLSDLYRQGCLRAAGVTYQSWDSFAESSVTHKLHLDGGIAGSVIEERFDRIPEPGNYLMYTGTFYDYCGLDLLLKAFAMTRGDARLVICGGCKSPRLLKLFEAAPRVDYKGFVSEQKLESLSRGAFAFVNSYLPSASESQGKFPSKIYEYLSYGRPVISTRTSGISPDYDGVLKMVDSESPDDLAAAINDVFAMDTAALNATTIRIKVFLERKTWDIQGQRFLDFLEMSLAKHKAEK